MKIATFALSLVLLCALQACGGGGGSGGSAGSTAVSPGNFTVSATTASFTSTEDGTPPPPQVLHVHLLDNSAAALGAAYVAPQTQPSWLKIAITGAAPDYDVTLSITTTALTPTTLSTTFTLGTADAAGHVLHTQTVQVSLTILQPVGVDRTTISDSFILGAAAGSARSAIGITADPTIRWSLTTSVPWITSSITGGAGSASATITVDASSLPVGTATGIITISDAADPTDSATISVSADVAPPTLTVSPSSITLGGADGLSETPQPLQIFLNTGGDSYPWSATLATNSGGNWLTMNPTSGDVGGAGTTANVDADYSLVNAGSYTGTLQVQATVKGVVVTQTVPVTLNKEQDWLYVSADGVAFSQFPSRSVLTRTLQVTSSEGRTDIPWAAQSDQGWLTVTPSGMTGGSLTLTANPTGLAPDQEYIADVTISSSDGSIGNTQNVRVGLWVGSSDPGDVSVSGTFSSLVANPVEPEVYVTDGAGDVLVYNVYTGALLRTLATTIAQTSQITISSDGTILFVSDATNLTVVSINPTTGVVIQRYPWGNGTVYLQDLAYARPSGHPILLLGNGSIYDVASGQKYQATFGQGAYELNFNLAVDGAAHFFYTQDRGLSPSTLTQYTLKYTALTPDGLIVTQGPSTWSAGSNGRGLCASADGSRVYTADGAPYAFSAFSSSNLQQIQTLQAAPYPVAAVCAWNGLFVGGADAYYDPVDVWVYESDGVQLATLNMHPATEHDLGPMTLSGDDTRVIGITGAPSLDFHSIPGP